MGLKSGLFGYQKPYGVIWVLLKYTIKWKCPSRANSLNTNLLNIMFLVLSVLKSGLFGHQKYFGDIWVPL